MKNDDHLLEFTRQHWKEALQPCIDKIIKMDKDNKGYIAKLRETFITQFQHSLFGGTYVGTVLIF